MSLCVFQAVDSDLTFEDEAVASPLSRHKRQGFWDTWGGDDTDAGYDDYEEEDYNDNDDYNGDYNDDYEDYNGNGGTTASGDGLEPLEPTLPTDDEDLVEGSGPTSSVEPRTGVRPTPPVPTAPAGLGECAQHADLIHYARERMRAWSTSCMRSSGAFLCQAGAIQLSALDLISDVKTLLVLKTAQKRVCVASEHARLVLNLRLYRVGHTSWCPGIDAWF